MPCTDNMRDRSEVILDKIVPIAGECGKMMLAADQDIIEAETKSSWRDLVTVYDKRIQDYAKDALKESFPEAGFLCEEENRSAEAEDKDALTFVIDPIDGTLNFVHHYGHSCISIACIQDKDPVAAVIYDPYKNELFTAELGKGAYLNGERIRVTDKCLKDTVVLFGTSPYNLELVDETMGRVRALYGHCLDIRRTGSAALDLCYVAAGRAGLYFELELSVWDYAAGALIVQEAGGICSNINGGSLQYCEPRKSSVVAGNIKTIEHIRKATRRSIQKRI